MKLRKLRREQQEQEQPLHELRARTSRVPQHLKDAWHALGDACQERPPLKWIRGGSKRLWPFPRLPWMPTGDEAHGLVSMSQHTKNLKISIRGRATGLATSPSFLRYRN